jgi:hypothetical protein
MSEVKPRYVAVPAEIRVWDPYYAQWVPMCLDCADAMALRGFDRTSDISAYTLPWPRCLCLHEAT